MCYIHFPASRQWPIYRSLVIATASCNRTHSGFFDIKHCYQRASADNISRNFSSRSGPTDQTWRLAPLNRFKPSSKIFYWPFQGGTSFVDLLCFCSVLCWLCFVRVCLYVLCGHLLGKGWSLGFRLWCLLWVCHFPIGILGQVWYLIVSIPDLCNLITFPDFFYHTF